MRIAFVTAAFVFSAAAGLSANAANADETTIIHEQRTVQPDQTRQSDSQQTAERQRTAIVASTHTRRHLVAHRTLIHHFARHAARPPSQASARAAGSSSVVDTSATVQQNTDQSATEAADPTVIDRRTVIHRDDEGNVERHTRTIQQGPDSTTVVDHSSSEPAAPANPAQ
jgi:hypothetical protein